MKIYKTNDQGLAIVFTREEFNQMNEVLQTGNPHIMHVEKGEDLKKERKQRTTTNRLDHPEDPLYNLRTQSRLALAEMVKIFADRRFSPIEPNFKKINEKYQLGQAGRFLFELEKRGIVENFYNETRAGKKIIWGSRITQKFLDSSNELLKSAS